MTSDSGVTRMEVHTMLAMLDPNEFIFLRFGYAMAEGYAEYELGDQVVRISRMPAG